MKTENKSVVRSIRFTPRTWAMAVEKAEYLGTKPPAYINQLGVKDNPEKN